MKYKLIQKTIEAEPYKKGMEDGFTCIPFVAMCENNKNGLYRQCKSCTLDIKKVAYIETEHGKIMALKNSYIITNKYGIKEVWSKEEFESTYEGDLT